MALKLLNPGLRPLGMFDLDDADLGTLVGGEYVELRSEDAVGAEGYAADVGQLEDATTIVNFIATERSAGNLGGLADEGVDEYGTLFGQLIGSNTGKATVVSGAVVLGPSTDRASGKVTVWATPGLYGVNGQDATLDSAAVNAAVYGTASTGRLTTAANAQKVAIYVGAMKDTSLVSTTNTAAGETATTEYHAVFYLGNAQA
jgi:hypothetical protein